MKKALTIFFVTLGVIFFLLILGGVYLYVADPLNLKPLIFGTETSESTNPTASEDAHPLLNDSQEKALETFGIDPADVPSEITADQEACFIEVLGAERVAEIQAGDTPTASEFFTARGCIE